MARPESYLSAAERAEAVKSARQRAIKEIRRRELLRLEIDSQKEIRDLVQIGDLLMCGMERVVNGGVEAVVPMDKDRVQQLTAAANVKFGLLRKTMPDLKQMEVTGEGGGAVSTAPEMTDLELANRLAYFTRHKVPEAMKAPPAALSAPDAPSFI